MAEKQCNLIKNGGGMSKYSTSEVLTGDTWIDGKPIYRKVCQKSFGTVTDGTQAEVNFTDMLPNNIDTLMPVYGECASLQISQAWGNYYIRFNGRLVFANRSVFSNQTCTVIFEYTKV
jgi:hypothetical protein